MAEDRIVEFYARLDARTVSLVMMINCPQMGVIKVTKTVQDWHTLTMED